MRLFAQRTDSLFEGEKAYRFFSDLSLKLGAYSFSYLAGVAGPPALDRKASTNWPTSSTNA